MAKKKWRRGIAVPKEMQNGEGMVRVRILPLHAIGGVGHAGDTAFMPLEEAEQYADDGYLEIIPLADDPVPSTAADTEPAEAKKPGGILGLFVKKPDTDNAPDARSEAESGNAQTDEVTGQPADDSIPLAEDHAIMQPENRRT